MLPLAEVRRPYQGLMQVLSFNRRKYATSLLFVLAGAIVLVIQGTHGPIAWFVLAVLAVTLWWTLASIAASHYVYDRSALWRWSWIDGLLDAAPTRWLHVHAGLDESTPALRRLFPPVSACVLDVYDERAMSEPSIALARSGRASGSTASFRHLPLRDADCDAAFLILSAHELRSASDRAVLFAEIARVLSPGGAVILVEHLRDLSNFVVYGPGALHFLSRQSWLDAAHGAGLELAHERRINAFVTAFVFAKSGRAD